MRDALRDIDLDFNKKVALIEFLIYKFRKDVNVNALVNSAQGNKVSQITDMHRFIGNY